MKYVLSALFCMLVFIQCKNRTDLPLSNKEYSPKEIKAASEKAQQLLEDLWEEELAMSPQRQTFLGRKTNYDKWDDLSEEQEKRELEFHKEALQLVTDSIHTDALDQQTALSCKLYVKQLETRIEGFQFRHNDYPVNQMFGTHSDIPSFLINQHKIDSYEDAMAYLTRLERVPELVGQLIEQLKIREEKNVIPPKFVFDHVIRDCRNIASGSPIGGKKTKENAIYADFAKKINKIVIEDGQKKSLLGGCEKRLNVNLKPAYDKLIEYLTQLKEKATNDDGVWKFDNGEAYFSYRLGLITTTDFSSEEIHQIGLQEVERIHKEMNVIRQAVGFEGDLNAFFNHLRESEEFYYPNNARGKQDYLEKATAIIDTMRTRLDQLFVTKPKAAMVVKAVEAFREQSAGKAFYNRPAPDGSRPGVYYVNTFNMADMPTYQMEALAYHEGIPGHHMQLSIAQEMEGLPSFRKFGGYTAYVEGWALYTEYLPKELGFYSDPYSDFGRLAMELWRACRLVVDTGIHSKKWTRQEGIDYYKKHTPNPEGDCIKMVERHIVMPGQATAYKIGMIKILELREKAKKEMGDSFDIREFHDVVLTSGAVPLDILEDLVNDYIATAG